MSFFAGIAAPQNKQRDCYASAPNLDLTLRSNGEESVKLMDSYGNFTEAGFDPPINPPILALGTAGSGLTSGTWVAYVYVHVAKTRYPLVDAGSTGGGSIAPRGNPSPSANINVTGGAHHVNVTVYTNSRLDVSHIWIYRTEYFNTAQEAIDAGNAGTLFWIAEIPNNPNIGTIIYDDATVTVSGEECDTDNYPSPQFQFCVYLAPYFWGFGNPPFICTCTVAADGSFVLIDQTYKLFDGRNGQNISFIGIASGGYDGHGNYYFKQTGDYTGQCCLDIGLTLNGPLDFTGDTTLTIQGQSNILYRSKPNNPLSWGDTDVIEDVRVPHLYAFRVGGGRGTAIAIIANLNLLKVDTEAPAVCYVMNLRLAGTSSFEESKRQLSDGQSVSNHFAQFPTVTDNGNVVLWGYDFKSSSILQCDGTSQIPISSKIFDTLRTFTVNKLNHGIYDDNTELAIFWYSTGKFGLVNDLAILYHVPTGNWSMHTDFDVNCSATIYDSVTGQNKTIIGTSTGIVGQAFADGFFTNWMQGHVTYAKFNIIATNPGADFTLQEVNSIAIFDTTQPWIWVGNYIKISTKSQDAPNDYQLAGAVAKIVALPSNNTIDIKIYSGFIDPAATECFGFIGIIPVGIQKFTQLNSPVTQKQLVEMFITVTGLFSLNSIIGWSFRPAIELSLANDFAGQDFALANHIHFKENEQGGVYVQWLNSSIKFGSIIGLQLDIVGVGLQISDYTLSFENA